MGDPGARLLSKALQINTSLKALSIDRNSITVHGYSDIAYALERYSNPIYLSNTLAPPWKYTSLLHLPFFLLLVDIVLTFCFVLFPS